MIYIEREDNMEKQRTIQEYVPEKQITLTHLIANPDKDMCIKLGLDEGKTNAIGILTITPGEATIISADIAIKSGSIELGFLDRFKCPIYQHSCEPAQLSHCTQRYPLFLLVVGTE